MTAHRQETDHLAGSPDVDDSDATERLLWRRVGLGLVWGLLVAALLGFVLISAIQPDVELAGRLGLAAFVGFWSGPFIGLSGAVGYHELKKRGADGHSKRPTSRPGLTRDGSESEYVPAA